MKVAAFDYALADLHETEAITAGGAAFDGLIALPDLLGRAPEGIEHAKAGAAFAVTLPQALKLEATALL